ncbi:Hypothetical protein NCS54_01391600 [Fusarium falciforme]|uniref:Hypothetical protein n=1 Tax=Fusarium falciforme TaxID=195108 RepID=UPI002301E557|nr:Hypothetical protein NCS54_01391600 [Fusarium falciforme]WAO96248.1 Hypothetical protein NCS54_01391600 [Fusarium falciforme]
MPDLTNLCPPDESRTSRELIVKLVVAHLTGVTAFCNLVSLRKDPLDSIEPILFFASPLIVLVQTALGLALMIFDFAIKVIKSPSSIREQGQLLERRWRILFCPRAEPKVEPLEMSQDGFIGTPCEKNSWRSNHDESAWVRLGRSIVTFGTLFQCLATIFLYNRRIELHGKESLTVADNRCFEIAVGSAFVSVLSIALLLRFPGFTQPAPEAEYKKEPKEDALYLFCRGDPRRCTCWYQFIYIKDFGSESTAATFFWCFLSSTLNGASIVVSIIKITYPGLYKAFVTQEGDHISMFDFYRNLAIVFGVLLTIVISFTKRVEKNDTFWSLIPLALAALSSIVLICLGAVFILYPFLIIWLPGMLSGVGSILFIKIKELKMLLGQPPFALASEEFPACPALWKDPMAEYLWSLM